MSGDLGHCSYLNEDINTQDSYFSKYILSNVTSNENITQNSVKDGVEFCSDNVAPVKVEEVLKRVAETARRYEKADKYYKPKRNKIYNKKIIQNQDFISFTQLQSQTDNLCEFEDDNLNLISTNNIKIDSQWTCDTQLATLVDNADAIVNMFSNDNTSVIENLQKETNEHDKTMTTSNNSTSKILQENLNLSDNSVFKIPLLKDAESSKSKRINFIPFSGSRSQTVNSLSSTIEPLLSSQYGFKTASQKEIQISEVSLQNASKLFQDIDKNLICYNSVFEEMNENVDDEISTQDNVDDKIITQDNGNDKISIQDTIGDKIVMQDNVDDTIITQDNGDDKIITQDNGADNIVTLDNGNDKISIQDTIGDKIVIQDNVDDKIITQDNVNDKIITQDNGDHNLNANILLSDSHEINLPSNVASDTMVESKNTKDSSSERQCYMANNNPLPTVEDSSKQSKTIASSLNKTYTVEEPVKSESRVIDHQDWETFFNDTMTSSDATKELCHGSDSDEDIPSSPILISQRGIDKVAPKKNMSLICKPSSSNVDKLGDSSKRFSGCIENKLISLPQKTVCGSTVDKCGEPSFIGFKTASDKEITISQEAVKRMKDIFEELNATVKISEEINDKSISRSEIETINDQEGITYKIDANGAKDDKSNGCEDTDNVFEDKAEVLEVIENVNGFTQEFINKSESYISELNDNNLIEDLKSNIANGDDENFGGFKITSQKKTPIMIKDLSKDKTVNIDCHDQEDLDFQVMDKNIPNSDVDIKIDVSGKNFRGFLTASNKEIKISEESLKIAKSLFDDTDIETEMGNINYEVITACNKKIDVSDDAIAKGKIILDNIVTKPNGNQNKIIKNFDNKVGHLKNCNVVAEKSIINFTTASNKDICVSNEALMKAESIFNDIDSEINVTNLVPSCCSIGFTTASNKEISISQHAFDEAKYLMENIDEDSNFVANLHGNNSSTTDDIVLDIPKGFSGFTTANNKTIDISQKALHKAKCLLDGIESEFNNDLIIDEKEDLVKAFDSGSKNDNTKTIMDQSKSPTKNITNEVSESMLNDSEKNFTVFKRPLSPQQDFIGFSTASRKRIKVSEEALVKAQSLLDNIDLPTDKDEKIDNFKGFTTASNKNIDISDDALTKARTVLSDFNSEQDLLHDYVNKNPKMIKFKEIDYFKEPFSTKESLFGFVTASSNKKVIVSDEALTKAKSFISSVMDSDREEPKKLFDVKGIENVAGFSGFTTAINKNVTVSKKALTKAKSFLSDIDFERSEDLPIEKDIGSSSKYLGFTTASNKKVNISEEALKKAKSFLSTEIEFDCEQPKESGVEKDIPSCSGFTTGSNKHVNVSKEVLTKAKSLLSDIDFEEPDNLLLDIQIPSSSGFPGFTTASNKIVNISKDALTKAKSFLSTEIEFDCEQPKKSVVEKDIPSCSGFTTASNKNVNVSKEVLTKAKSLLSNIDFEEPDNLLLDIEIPSSSGFPGFTTASNKMVNISEDALTKAKSFLATAMEFDDQETNQLFSEKDIANSFGFSGFTTASNKIVNVSKEALIKVKSLMSDIDLKGTENLSVEKEVTNFAGYSEFTTTSNMKENVKEDAEVDGEEPQNLSSKREVDMAEFSTAVSDEAILKAGNHFVGLDADEDHTERNNAFCGFKTAGNNKIAVSEESLIKARSLFDTIDSNQIIDHNILKNTDQLIGMEDKFCSKITTESILDNNKGFLKVGNKKIDVSVESSKAVQSLFSDLDCKEDIVKSDGDSNCGSLKQENPSLTQEINESTKALLHDEHLFNVEEKSAMIIDDIETPSSPILPTRTKKGKKDLKKMTKLSGKHETIREVNTEMKCLEKIEENCKVMIKNIDLGNLFNEKSVKNDTKMKLKNLRPTLQDTVLNITNISPDNFDQFVFENARIDVVDLKNYKRKISVQDLSEIFLDNSNVDRKLVPDNWIMNHLKWIIWKLASYERFFNEDLNGVLTVSNVLMELKYRYDKELYKAERSFLRKILECDDVAGRKMVLCVSRIIKNINGDDKSSELLSDLPRCDLEVTDGWYSVLASIDVLLTSAIQSGRLRVGTKIITCGAELHNCGHGKSPLEDISEVRLVLRGNSTRIAPWHYKLGPCDTPGPLRVSIGSVRPRAGSVPILFFLPLVVYPQQYVEKLPTGDTVTRSEKLEEVYLSSVESKMQAHMEQLYSEAEREVTEDARDGKTRPRCKVDRNVKMCDEDELFQMMEEANDVGEFLVSLTASQHASVMNMAEKKQLEMRERIDARMNELMTQKGVGNVNRKVVSILKVRGLILETEKSLNRVIPVMLTVWKVEENILELLKRMHLLNLFWATPTGHRSGELHLSTNKQTRFTEVKNQNYLNRFPNIQKWIRGSTSILEMNNPSFTPMFNEVDTVGLVFKIEPSIMTQSNLSSSKNEHQMSPNFQTVYICDENMNIAAVHFWGGIVKFGYEKIVETSKLLACSNLQHRPRSSRKRFRNLYVTEYSTFSQRPRKKSMNEIYESLEHKFKLINLSEFMNKCIIHLNELSKKTPLSSFNYSSFKQNVVDFSRRTKRKLELDENSLSGLDFDSSFNEPSTSHSMIGFSRHNITSVSLRGDDIAPSDVDQRIKRLKMYGEPPPLSPILLNFSKTVKKDYICPQVNDGAENINRSVVVVKINDDKFKNDSDPFKENFVYSPPDLE